MTARILIVDDDEPRRVAETLSGLNLNYVVITSVDRDDLADGGMAHVAACVDAIRRRRPGTRVETLISDAKGDDAALDVLLCRALEETGRDLALWPARGEDAALYGVCDEAISAASPSSSSSPIPSSCALFSCSFRPLSSALRCRTCRRPHPARCRRLSRSRRCGRPRCPRRRGSRRRRRRRHQHPRRTQDAKIHDVATPPMEA